MTHNKERVLFILSFSLFFFSIVFASVKNAAAESRTVLRVKPEVTRLNVGEGSTVVLFLENGVNLAGYDITIKYDSTILGLVSWEQGGFLTNPVVIKQVNTPGSLRIVAAQLGAPGVSGDGNLLKIDFNGISIGESPVRLTGVQLVSSSNEYISADQVDGAIIVADIVQTMTPTVTASATPVPPLIPSKTSTSQPPAIITATSNIAITLVSEPSKTSTQILSARNSTTITSQAGPSYQTATYVSRSFLSPSQTPLVESPFQQTTKSFSSVPGIDQEQTRKNEEINSWLWVVFSALIAGIALLSFLLSRQSKG